MKEKYKEMLDLIDEINKQREAQGFLTIKELTTLIKEDNIIFDPFSTLISKEAKIGKNNIFYPSVTIETDNNGIISIGDKNKFFSQTYILANLGEITIGDHNQFGEGGISIKANQKNSKIIIGNNGRYINHVQIIGTTHLGSGSQIIGGPITVQDCLLKGGLVYTSDDPDKRGGVIKGFGIARDLIISTGEVINGLGSFDSEMIQRQSFYHPKK